MCIVHPPTPSHLFHFHPRPPPIFFFCCTSRENMPRLKKNARASAFRCVSEPHGIWLTSLPPASNKKHQTTAMGDILATMQTRAIVLFDDLFFQSSSHYVATPKGVVGFFSQAEWKRCTATAPLSAPLSYHNGCVITATASTSVQSRQSVRPPAYTHATAADDTEMRKSPSHRYQPLPTHPQLPIQHTFSKTKGLDSNSRRFVGRQARGRSSCKKRRTNGSPVNRFSEISCGGSTAGRRHALGRCCREDSRLGEADGSDCEDWRRLVTPKTPNRPAPPTRKFWLFWAYFLTGLKKADEYRQGEYRQRSPGDCS